MRGNDNPIALGRCAFAIASSASGNNGGFREALRLKPLPPVRQLKGGKGGSEILLPGAYVDGGKVGCIKADTAEAATVCICGVPKPLCGLCAIGDDAVSCRLESS